MLPQATHVARFSGSLFLLLIFSGANLSASEGGRDCDHRQGTLIELDSAHRDPFLRFCLMNITDRAMMTPMSIAPNPTKKICCTSSLRPGMNVPSFMLSTRSNTDPINRPMVTTHTMTHTTEAAASIYFLKASFQIVG